MKINQVKMDHLRWMLFALFFLLVVIVPSLNAKCTCQDAALCNPITTGPRKEFFVFQYPNGYEGYDWNTITTVGAFGDIFDPQLICTAHKAGARVVFGAFYPPNQLNNASNRATWISQQIAKVVDAGADGLNFDVEDAIADNSENRRLLNVLVNETKTALLAANPHYQLTFDVAWSPKCIDGRCYDFLGLSKIVEFLIVMDYDMRSQIFGPCIASANSPPALISDGMHAFLDLGIPSDQLVLGLPWYGYDYPCLSLTDDVCKIAEVPFRGVNCSDAAGKQRPFSNLLAQLNQTGIVPTLDAGLESLWYNYVDSSTKQSHQVWFDDPKTLQYKVQWGKTNKLRGVSMWTGNFVDFARFPEASRQMWEAMNSFF